jgi:hypothetical protein
MSDSLFDNLIPDGTVGRISRLEESPPIVAREGLPILVSLGGDTAALADVTSLTIDITYLVETYRRLSKSGKHERPASCAQDSGEALEVEIAIHGLEFEPDVEAELRERIRDLVRSRLSLEKESV